MQTRDFSKEYQAKTDEELLRLTTDAERLTSEARSQLANEVARRGIKAKPKEGLDPGEDLHTVGVPSPTEISKAPWRPKIAGRIAFFFGPLAGAQVVAVSLRRMGHPQAAKRVILLALGMSVAEAAIIFFIPDVFSRLVGLVAEIAFLLIFPVFMEKEFAEWEASHPSAAPSSGWNAIGWGFVGSVVFVVVISLVFVLLAAMIPGSH